MKDIYSFVDLLKNVHEKFALTDEGDLEKNLGVKIMQLDKKRFKVSQTCLIDRIVSFLVFNPDKFDMKTFSMASLVGKGLLHKDFEGNPCKEQWSYCTNVGMLLYL